MELRQYQKDTLNNVVRSYQAGHRKIILQAATGSGKTIMACAMIQHYVGKGLNIMFLAHRRELIIQCSNKLGDFGLTHGIIMADITPNIFASIQVASIDTLRARAINKKKMELPKADLIIIDEAHRSMSPTYLKLMEKYPKALVLGLTATPVRGDGDGLGNVYSDMVQAPSIKELTKQGHLVEAVYYAPSIPDLKGVGTIAGDYNSKDLEERMDRVNLVGDVISTWKHIGKGKPTIVFASGVKHSMNLCNTFLEQGIKAAHLDGGTPTKQRVEILSKFQSGEITVICNCMVLTEGFDAPAATVCVLARPTKSLSLYIQMVGRVLRPHPDKEHAIIIDHSGAVYTHGFATDDQDWKLTKGKAEDRERTEGDAKEENSTTCEGCFQVFKGSNICPNCGTINKSRDKYVAFIEAELGLVNKVTRKVEKKEQYGEGFRKKFYSELLGHAIVKGYKVGWAAMKFKERFKTYPAFGETPAMEPSKETKSYIRHLQIKHAKRRRR